MLSLKQILKQILNLWKPIPREGEVTGAATKPARGISPSDQPGFAYIRTKGGLTTHNLLGGIFAH